MEDMRPAIVAVIVTFQVLGWIAMAMRLYVRQFLVKKMGWDDCKFIDSTPGTNN
jgi:hypothetical protein